MWAWVTVVSQPARCVSLGLSLTSMSHHVRWCAPVQAESHGRTCLDECLRCPRRVNDRYTCLARTFTDRANAFHSILFVNINTNAHNELFPIRLGLVWLCCLVITIFASMFFMSVQVNYLFTFASLIPPCCAFLFTCERKQEHEHSWAWWEGERKITNMTTG